MFGEMKVTKGRPRLVVRPDGLECELETRTLALKES